MRCCDEVTKHVLSVPTLPGMSAFSRGQQKITGWSVVPLHVRETHSSWSGDACWLPLNHRVVGECGNPKWTRCHGLRRPASVPVLPSLSTYPAHKTGPTLLPLEHGDARTPKTTARTNETCTTAVPTHRMTPSNSWHHVRHPVTAECPKLHVTVRKDGKSISPGGATTPCS